MTNKQSTVSLLAVGDVQIMAPEPPRDLFTHVSDALTRADISFGNCEWPHSEEPGDTHPVEAHINDLFDDGDLFLPGSPDSIRMMAEHGFNIMSVANNHTMHAGYRAFLRTLSLLKESNIKPVGGGANIEEARRPAIIERNGQKIAFLACTSGFLPGAHAGRRTPGIVPLRRHSYVENPAWEQWGIEPDIRTLVSREDLNALCDSIRAVREEADVVIMSCHWGILEHPSAIGEFQRDAARAMIDAGVDLIIGHGPLALKGFEVYRGKAVLYSLGKFMMAATWALDNVPSGISAPLIDESRKGLAASITIDNGAVTGIQLIPVWTDDSRKPVLLKPGDKFFDTIIGDIQERTAAAKLNGVIDANGTIELQ